VPLCARDGGRGWRAGGRLRRAVDHRRDLLEGHGEHVVQHEREPFGWAERVEHDLQRDPDRGCEQRLVFGIGPGRGVVDDRSGRKRSNGCSPRVRRDRSMFRQIRETTVVSHRSRVSICSTSVRASRSHVSCTASSASLTEPRIR